MQQPANSADWPTWDTLSVPLSQVTQEVLSDLGFKHMTPVQAATIPLLLNQRKDVAVQAQTGSGKTLAFLIPAIELLCRRLAAEAAGEVPQLADDADDVFCHPVNAIIISPTRELALQIFSIAEKFAQKRPGLTVCLFVGGSDLSKSEEGFKAHGGRLVVGTPGRLESSLQTLIRSHHMSVQQFDLLILDEADRLLDMGFEVALDNIIRRLPRQRRTGLFSATQTRRVQQLSRVGLRNPTFVDTDSKVTFVPHLAASSPEAEGTDMDGDLDSQAGAAGRSAPASAAPDGLQNFYHMVDPQRKFEHMVEFIRARMRTSKMIVFFLTCAEVEYFLLVLQHLFDAKPQIEDKHQQQSASRRPNKKLKTGHDGAAQSAAAASAVSSSGVVCGLHGQMVNKRRLAEYERFLACESGIMLCTDVAARGVDVPDVDWIIQFDCPKFPDSFIHRIGRTARMGRRGNSLVYLTPNEEAYVGFMHQQRVRMQPLPESLQPAPSPFGAPPKAEVVAAGVDDSEDDEGDEGDESDEEAAAREQEDEEKEQAESAGLVKKDNPTKGGIPVPSLYTELQLSVLRLARSDRNVMEKGQRAFVSFVRAYKEHACSFIFVLAELPLADCAHGWGLLFYPVMPDTKYLKVIFVNPIPGLKPDAVAFKDKFREKQRMANVELRRQKREVEKRKRLDKERQRKKLKNPDQPKRRRKRLHQEFINEWDELQQEERLFRRLRQKRISRKEYNEELEQIEINILEANKKAESIKVAKASKGKSEGALHNDEIEAAKDKKKAAAKKRKRQPKA